jgi:hypothetical protein
MVTARTGAARHRARLTVESGVLGLVVGLLVVAPWTSSGFLLLVDWVSGPETTRSAASYGLSGTTLDALPFRIGTQLLRDLVGPAATAWLVVLAFFPLAAAGASQLAGSGRVRRTVAALVVVCNPFVLDRVQAGHVAFLLGVAVLPWLFRSALHARERDRWFAVRPAAWYAAAMAMSPHLFWLGGVVLVAVALLPQPTWRHVVRTVLVGLSAGLVYAYGIAVYLAGVRVGEVGRADLDAFATSVGDGGLLGTLLSLQGFWRDFDHGVTDAVPPVLALLALAVGLAGAFLGAVVLVSRERAIGAPLLAIAVVGTVLASGVSGPFRPLYEALFDHVPLFVVMREQQKWLALLMLAMAVWLGAAAEHLVQAARSADGRDRWARGGLLAGAVAIAAVPLVTAPALLLGVGGTIATSAYPSSWYDADELMGDGQEGALFLPWHGYQPFDFTDGRSVATPAEVFFRRDVLSSDAVELGDLRTGSTSRCIAYVDRLVAAGGAGDSFGRLVAPLGVRYVVLARGPEDAAYSWVGRQDDLRLVLDTDSVRVYEVVPTGTGRVVGQRVVADLDELAALADSDGLGTEAVVEGDPAPAARSEAAGGLLRDGTTRWLLDPGTAGWVVVPEEYAPGWRLDGRSGVPTVAGTIAVRADGSAGEIEYEPWALIRLAILASSAVLVLLVLAGLVEHRAELARVVRGRHSRDRDPADA